MQQGLDEGDRPPVRYLPLGGQNMPKLPGLVADAAKRGDWILLDGLHFVHHYITAIETFLQQMHTKLRGISVQRSSSRYSASPGQEETCLIGGVEVECQHARAEARI